MLTMSLRFMMKRAKWSDKCCICKMKRSFQERLLGIPVCYPCMESEQENRFKEELNTAFQNKKNEVSKSG